MIVELAISELNQNFTKVSCLDRHVCESSLSVHGSLDIDEAVEDGGIVRKADRCRPQWRGGEVIGVDIVEDRLSMIPGGFLAWEYGLFWILLLEFSLGRKSCIMEVVGYFLYQKIPPVGCVVVESRYNYVSCSEELMACERFLPESVLDVWDDAIVQGVFFNSF
ncbi:hypothetical protein TNCV_1802071 [Trichonephila clavipes]|nr:hypothetical protein TNCV_1802071 [Trichonephila clavipes]